MATEVIKFGALYLTSCPMTPGEFARRAESLGYDSVWAGETPCNRQPNLDPVTSLSFAAAATTHIKIGTNVLLTPLHHPAWLAKQWGSLDVLSGGRVICGLGVGGDAAGLGDIQFSLFDIPVSERGRRTNEAIEVMKKLWTEPVASYDGDFFRFDGIVMEPHPLQSPHPPIWIGGRPGGLEKNPDGQWRFKSKLAAIQRAATYGDGWCPFYVTPEQYRDSVSAIEERADQIGRRINHMEWALTTHWTIRNTYDEALELASSSQRYGRKLGEKVARYEILGNAKNAIARIEQYIDAGARHIICGWRCPPHEILWHLEAIATDVIAHFR